MVHELYTGTHRHQTYIATLDDKKPVDNFVRLIDAFLDKLDLSKLGFTNTVYKSEGRQKIMAGRILNKSCYRVHNQIAKYFPRKDFSIKQVFAVVKNNSLYQPNYCSAKP